MEQSPLDHPIWAALTTGHKAFAEGGSLARRYPADFAPFGAVANTSAVAFEALRALIAPESRVVLFTADNVTPACDLKTQLEAPIIQMSAPDLVVAPDVGVTQVVLGEADASEMLRLADSTRPGPFGPRTHELGEYIGVRVDGHLAAMTGERMRLNGFTEISAVCVHPDHRGKGYAQFLVARLAARIRDRGDAPFLHVFADNQSAIALYRRLGFTIRRQLYVTVLQRLETAKSGM